MRRIVLLALFFVLLAASAAGTPTTPEPAFVLRVYRIEENPAGRSEAGTAFAVRYGRRLGIMTAVHVVAVPEEPYLVEAQGVTRKLVFARIGTTDVAFAELPAVPGEWRVLMIGPPPAVGEKVTAWGLPGVGGLISTTGPISKRESSVIHPARARGAWAEVETASLPGMSGGPVLGPDRSVFGVLSSHYGWKRSGGPERETTVVAEIPAPTP